jgi:hypothetical protein
MKKINKLIPENYPDNYNGYKFISLIKFNQKSYISIIDNVISNNISAFILDECQTINVDEKKLILNAQEWFDAECKNIPFSIFLSRRNLLQEYSGIIKCFPVDFVSRVLGPLFTFNMNNPVKIKRKRKKDIPDNIEIVYKKSVESPEVIL